MPGAHRDLSTVARPAATERRQAAPASRQMIPLDTDRSLGADYQNESQSRSWAVSQDHRPKITGDRPHTPNCQGPAPTLAIRYPCEPRRTVARPLGPVGSAAGGADRRYLPSFRSQTMSGGRIALDKPSLSASTCSAPGRAGESARFPKARVIMPVMRISARGTYSWQQRSPRVDGSGQI
jgi:hypothetical protein